MKKTLVALAALAATASFAQSSVVIDGFIDRGVLQTNNSNNTKDFKGLGSNSGTTTVGIKVVEDLGGGLKVGLSLNTDWGDVGGMIQDGSAGGAGVGGIAGQTGIFGNSASYVDVISATAGTLRLGSPNHDTLTNASGVASPALSTGVGSAYSSSFSVHDGYGTGTTGSGGIVTAVTRGSTAAGARGIRIANTVKYISPVMNGFQVSFSTAQPNSVSGTGDTVGMNEASLRYTNGPLDVMYTSLEYKVGTGTAPTSGGLTAGASNKMNMLGAAYQVSPALKLHAGFGNSSGSTVAIADSDSTQFGVTYTVGAFDFMAQTAKVDDKNTTAYDRKMTGLGINYNLSKTTRAYVRYDSLNLDTAAASSGSEIKRTAVGVSKSF